MCLKSYRIQQWQRWELIEDYFLGVIPEKVKHECRKSYPDIIFD